MTIATMTIAVVIAVKHNWAQFLSINVPFGASLEDEIWTS